MIEFRRLPPYKTYEEIPIELVIYIEKLTGALNIEEIPLEEVNKFFLELAARDKREKDKWEDGWVLEEAA